MHIRQQIREAVGTVLGSGTTWNHVFESRLSPSRDVLPYLLAYIEAEQSIEESIHSGGVMARELALTIKGRCRIVDKETFEDTLDDIAVEVESTLTRAALNALLSNKIHGLYLTSTATDAVSDDDEREYAEITLEYMIKVFTAEESPETLI